MISGVKALFNYHMRDDHIKQVTERKITNEVDIIRSLMKIRSYIRKERETWYKISHSPGMDDIYQSYARGRFIAYESLEGWLDEELNDPGVDLI